MRQRNLKRHGREQVELNLAAMLDMAFQLLTFFILTFKPSPVEGRVELTLPAAKTVVGAVDKNCGGDHPALPNELSSLVVRALPNESGSLGTLTIGKIPIGNLASLDSRLREMLLDHASPFDQVVIQVGSCLRYDAVMGVIDICTRQRFSNGARLKRLSFIELPDVIR